jgi:hypothetical protein
MIHRPTKALRITSGPLAGKTYITTKNVDTSISVRSDAKMVTKMNIPNRGLPKITPGLGGLTSSTKPTMINGNKVT